MRRALAALALVMSAVGLSAPTSAAPGPTRTLSVTGTGVEMYPAFDPTIDRYAVTTTADTGGRLDITATTSDPAGRVLVDGRPTTSPTTTVSDLSPGDEVSVIVTDAGSSTTAYSVMYLPAGFPKLTVTGGAQAQFPDLAPGQVALTLNTFGFNPLPAFDAIVDRNGVPIYAVAAAQGDLDLKQQPNGEISVSRPTTVPGHVGDSLVTLDDQLEEAERRDVAGGLTSTDGHDSVRLPDGSTILIGYQPNLVTGKTDATIQKLDAADHPVFTWTSAAYAGETLAATTSPDYAHINSVVSVEDGDIIASFRHLSAIYRIATVAHGIYQKGDIIWKLGGRDSDFTFVDDPYPGGPCAQHAVSQLANGHILVYDNGTSGFCVDPSNPLNPGIARGQTRITEYALDIAAHTATLVWSYAPADKYAFFAGSARRVANGNTLIGWAADKDSLATEVNTEKNVLWDIKTPPGSLQYMTYRAELVDVPDRISPTIATDYADGAVYVLGDHQAAPDATCADRGGSNLQTCVASSDVSSSLDTSTTGPHTWQVTAQDGAGNTTTLVRHYAVRSGRQPDSLVRRAGSTWWRGGDVYGAATDQTIGQHAHRRHTVKAFWRAQNDGERPDALSLRGTAGTSRYTVHYFAGSTDVTRAVVAGTYRTSTLAPGATTTLRVEVTPTRHARVGRARTFTLRATSVTSATTTDQAATRVTARR